METVLVTGGNGYIGYNTLSYFKKKNYNVLSLDNLSRGNLWKSKDNSFIKGDIDDKKLVSKIISKYKVKTIVHFAAYAYVGESMISPSMYYHNNVIKSLIFLETVAELGIKNFIFSSSCAVYGNPTSIPISESHPTKPINPYGETKLIIENAIYWYSKKYNFKYVILRYFNASGSSQISKFGEYHNPETHLIPLLIKSILVKDYCFKIFGSNYKTKDGSAVRDFIHIDDLSKAHFLAYKYLSTGGKNQVLNLGNGIGYSIFEVIDMLERITGKSIEFKITSSRKGDPPILIANYDKAKKIINWIPEIGLKRILITALDWQSITLPKLLKEKKLNY